MNHGQTWRGWERSGEKGLIISDNQAQTWLIITINDTSIGDLPLIITISDTCKKWTTLIVYKWLLKLFNFNFQPNRLDFDNTINLSSLIVSLALRILRLFLFSYPFLPGHLSLCTDTHFHSPLLVYRDQNVQRVNRKSTETSFIMKLYVSHYQPVRLPLATAMKNLQS